MNPLEQTSWSPYVVGAGIGILSWFAFASAKRPLGITGAFETTAVALGERVAPRALGVNAFLAESDKTPKIDWEWTLAAGVVAGSMASALASGNTDRGTVPVQWAQAFGPSPVTRALGAFVGGGLMMFGARMAKGCTSGHGISGTMQLASSSWLFTPLMAVTAGVVARQLLQERG